MTETKTKPDKIFGTPTEDLVCYQCGGPAEFWRCTSKVHARHVNNKIEGFVVNMLCEDCYND